MPEVRVHDRSLTYAVTGDGFPLLLAPGPQGTGAVWGQCLPLLAELCRTITYEYGAAGSTQTARGLDAATALAGDVEALCQALALERLYLASLTPTWPVALSFARRSPQRLEALLLIGTPGAPPAPAQDATPTADSAISVPTLLLVPDQAGATPPATATLAARLPHCTQVTLPAAHFAPHPDEASLQVGHAMMHFLIHRERQRNLVRGASFLL